MCDPGDSTVAAEVSGRTPKTRTTRLRHLPCTAPLALANRVLSNASYASKRVILQKSHVELNRYFGTEEMWSELAISRRADLMADLAIQIWPDFARGGPG